MDVIVGGDLLEFIDHRCWDDDFVPGETECEWIGVVVSNDPETHEGGGVCDTPRHLCVGNRVDEVLVQLLFQHAEVCRLLGADECLELIEGDLAVVIGGGDLLGECVVVSGVLEVLRSAVTRTSVRSSPRTAASASARSMSRLGPETARASYRYS